MGAWLIESYAHRSVAKVSVPVATLPRIPGYHLKSRLGAGGTKARAPYRHASAETKERIAEFLTEGVAVDAVCERLRVSRSLVKRVQTKRYRESPRTVGGATENGRPKTPVDVVRY